MRIINRAKHRFSAWNRRRKLAFMRRFVEQHGLRTVIFVGTGGRRKPSAGMIEDGIAPLVRVIAGCDVQVRPYAFAPFVVCDGRALPFRDGAVDLVISNAVLEHVGDVDDQLRFLAEHARVGRRWIATTPNRWFPVEAHTDAVFRHWSPRWRAAHSEVFTRLLTRRELLGLLPTPHSRVRGRFWSATFTAHGPGAQADTSLDPRDGAAGARLGQEVALNHSPHPAWSRWGLPREAAGLLTGQRGGERP
jgi:SAM-dependent methyltransferase